MITEFDRTILNALLAGELPELAILRAQADVADVSERSLAGVGFFTTLLVSWPRGSQHNSRAGHPGSLRCSSLTYSRYARSSRLAIRAPRSGIYATIHAVRTLVPAGAPRLAVTGQCAINGDVMLSSLGAAFLKPIFDLARLDPQAFIVLESLRRRGIKTAIVSNTPWGSSASAWRTELARHSLLDRVDAVVFCVDVGWRRPHRAPFDRALALLDVVPTDAVFVGDDPRWDVAGVQNAGVRPVLLGSSASAPGLKAILNLEDILGFVNEAPV